MEISVAAQI